jgi:DNA-binding NarL/FixJ family response regulator
VSQRQVNGNSHWAAHLQNNKSVTKQPRTAFKLKVLFVEDDPFTLNTVTELLKNLDLTVMAVSNVPDAVRALAEFEPNVVVTDLDLGARPDGTDLLNHTDENYPRIGKVILTAHSSPSLAVNTGQMLPDDVTFLIKSLATSHDIYEAILDSVHGGIEPRTMSLESTEGIFVVSKSQAELLRMLADGLSNAAIARQRNRTLAATESLIHRLFASLNLESNPDVNQRVVAVKMWQQGKVLIK